MTFRAFLWVGVTGCDLVCVSVAECEWVWLGVTGCWVVG